MPYDFSCNKVYYIAKIEKEDLFNKLDVDRNAESVKTQIDNYAKEKLSDIEAKAAKLLSEANIEANQIKEGAARVSTGTSIKEAQNQFDKAREHNLIQVGIWGALILLTITGFMFVLYKIYHLAPDEWGVEFIYQTAIRIIGLAFIGTILAFFIRLFKSNMHLYQVNLHRKRLSNSLEAFLGAARSDDQKDIILSHLVDAISNFGNSGLVSNEDDSSSPSKMMIDNISRNLTDSKGS